jgi:pyruvate dehydrogenase E1 component
MPDFWQFPTVSMGLGPIMAIYQARFLKYLHNRGIADTSKRKVWCFLGDGETDEPEALGSISLAGHEGLDNLIFVINCNLQRLDGPVRGNGKIIQELEGMFRGAGWNVIKVIWGSRWDALLAQDKDGLLRKRMDEAVDGEYQNYKAKGGAYTREHFFGAYPELKEMVANMTDADVWRLNRGGHDPHKVYAAYHAAVNHGGEPTVVLAKTVKGYGMGEAGEAQNISHQQKKLDAKAVRQFRNRFNVPIADEDLDSVPYYRPPDDSPEIQYLKERRSELGGFLPQRKFGPQPLEVPELEAFASLLKETGEREVSTTMTFVRALAIMLRDENIAERIVPIVADEARTFGMEGMFRQLGIYSSKGQLYTPVDSEQLMFYKEDTKGQILQEGISEAGAMSSWIAAATSYANSNMPMIPFYAFYSMFGFQRVGDLAWASGDMRARGFLIGGTSGRTTLNGEGLQHEDGNSQLTATVIPNCIAYDPTFAYELAVILQDGLRRMYHDLEDVYYYITVMNENYPHPAMPEGVEEGIRKGLYCFRDNGGEGPRVQLMGSGAILREAIAAAEMLEAEHGVRATVWSATSFTQLARDGAAVSRANRLNPDADPQEPWVARCLQGHEGPVVAASDYVRGFAEQIRPYLPTSDYTVLGTDGYGRSDTRQNLRRFFEVDRNNIAYAALHALYRQDEISREALVKARGKLGLDPDKPDPIGV